MVSSNTETASDDASVVLRDATLRDIPAIARLHVATFNETHGPGPAIELRERQWQDAFSRPAADWFCIVLEIPSRELVGFARGVRHTGGELADYAGELNKIYVLRGYHRPGLGRVLLCGAIRRFLDRDMTSILLFGDAASPTNGFYEAMGGTRILAPNGDFHGRYGWLDLRQVRCDEPDQRPAAEYSPRVRS